MVLSLEEASKIIGRSEDELMFLHQTNKVQARVNQESLAWEFDLQEILQVKTMLESQENGQTEEG